MSIVEKSILGRKQAWRFLSTTDSFEFENIQLDRKAKEWVQVIIAKESNFYQNICLKCIEIIQRKHEDKSNNSSTYTFETWVNAVNYEMIVNV